MAIQSYFLSKLLFQSLYFLASTFSMQLYFLARATISEDAVFQNS